MKKLLLFICLLTTSIAYSQDKKAQEKPKTQLEAFSDKSGSLIKKEYINLGKVSGVMFQILVLTDVVNNTTSKGLRLDYDTGGTYSTESIAFLDSDELDGLIKSLKYCIDNVLNTPPPASDIEYNFQGKSGFTSGIYNYNNKWKGYVKLEKFDSRSQVSFAGEDLHQVLDLVVLAQSKM